jgi:hypothetical protein
LVTRQCKAFGGALQPSELKQLVHALCASAALRLDPNRGARELSKKLRRDVREDGVRALDGQPLPGAKESGG